MDHLGVTWLYKLTVTDPEVKGRPSLYDPAYKNNPQTFHSAWKQTQLPETTHNRLSQGYLVSEHTCAHFKHFVHKPYSLFLQGTGLVLGSGDSSCAPCRSQLLPCVLRSVTRSLRVSGNLWPRAAQQKARLRRLSPSPAASESPGSTTDPPPSGEKSIL